jgi:hypothetical protein
MPRLKLPPEWTPQERWTFGEIISGREADLKAKYGGPAPGAAGAWPPERYLSPQFVDAISARAPYREMVPRQGVQISSARFTNKLTLAGAKIDSDLSLRKSQFDAGLDLSGARLDRSLRLTGSTIAGVAQIDGVQIGNSLMLNNARLDGVSMVDAKVGADLNLAGDQVSRDINLDGVQVGERAALDRAIFRRNLTMRAAKIGNQLTMDSSTVEGALDMQDIRVGGSLQMRDVNAVGNVSLIYSQIDGNLDLSSYYIEPADRVECTLNPEEEAAVAMLKRKSRPRSGLPYKVDLTGAHIGEALRFGSCKRRAPRWPAGAWLILRNVSVRDLQDRDEGCDANRPDCRPAWPDHIDFDGFTFEHLGALDVDSRSNMERRGTDWWVAWLARQDWTYSPQPYEELGSILGKLGYPERAKDILYEGKQRESAEARWPTRVWLFLMQIFIGYGYRLHYAFYWALGFVGLGAVVLRVSGEGPRNKMPYGIAFSFDQLLPFVRLRELHYQIDLHGWANYYFYFHKLMGYVLGIFLAAGLSGLVK